jgi:cytochrome o ubiquinol oxidase subunit II
MLANGAHFWKRCAAVLALGACVAGCQTSVLDPRGPIGAQEKTILLNALAIMLAIVIPTIIATLAFAWWFRASNTKARYRPDFAYSGRIELIVWSIPVLVILFLGGVTWIGSHQLDPARPIASRVAPVEVQVVALDWKWLFLYPAQGVASVNELVIPAGTPVHFSITSASVMNAFFVPQLGGQIYAMNGMVTHLSLQADKPGLYHGLSSHFSGDGFSDMGFAVRAVPPDAFAIWAASARTSGPSLDAKAYAALAEQSQAIRPYTYRAIDPALFAAIATRRIAPGPGPAPGQPQRAISPRTEP